MAMKPTILGGIVKECRKIERILKWRERNAETACILEKMNKADGMQLKGFDDETLEDVIKGALAVADHAEAEAKRNPQPTGQPEEQAALYIRERLGNYDYLN